ncbi:hypothetical protein C486_10450 [Natrinema gari JCM 14663]|uniref:Uncharacterized protein n=1 Tax=Natrinema gari JCM 14663 TaxID=1230459 RepID=L9Z4L5_9EURY|nr:hypothetical protein C486_10450 [Natrinema gari JCM 14663]
MTIEYLARKIRGNVSILAGRARSTEGLDVFIEQNRRRDWGQSRRNA